MWAFIVVVILVFVVVACTKSKASKPSVSNAKPSNSATSDLYSFFEQKYSKMREQGLKAYPHSNRARAAGCPYPWATEYEEDMMSDGTYFGHGQAVRGDVMCILKLLILYKNGYKEADNSEEHTIFRDEDKVAYWKGYLIQMAKAGDRCCQAALTVAEERRLSAPKHIANDIAWATPEECAEWKQLYEAALLRDAESGDPAAQYAVACVQLGDATYLSDKRLAYLLSAGQAGIGDGYYGYADEYIQRKLREPGQPSTFTESPYLPEYYDYVQKCADLNNGVYCGVAQYEIGGVYEDGKAGRPKDQNKARHYYELAVENGSPRAVSHLKYLCSCN